MSSSAASVDRAVKYSSDGHAACFRWYDLSKPPIRSRQTIGPSRTMCATVSSGNGMMLPEMNKENDSLFGCNRLFGDLYPSRNCRRQCDELHEYRIV